jgi:predicted nuclease of predicted toxin-antitoxin system
MAFRFVFDQHVNARALKQLQAQGVDVVHVAEVGLSEADDAEILAWSIDQGRIVITRNYQDYAPLASIYAERGLAFPGILFLATSVPQADAGRHVQSLLAWIEAADQAGHNPVASTYGWLR